MITVGIDPGPKESGIACITASPPVEPQFHWSAIVNNDEVPKILGVMVIVAVEMPQQFAKREGGWVPQSLLDTCVEIGRMTSRVSRKRLHFLRPQQVRASILGSVRGNDADIRRALIDLWGGKEKAIGNIRHPGPLYKVSSHSWSALAVAVAWQRLNDEKFQAKK